MHAFNCQLNVFIAAVLQTQYCTTDTILCYRQCILCCRGPERWNHNEQKTMYSLNVGPGSFIVIEKQQQTKNVYRQKSTKVAGRYDSFGTVLLQQRRRLCLTRQSLNVLELWGGGVARRPSLMTSEHGVDGVVEPLHRQVHHLPEGLVLGAPPVHEHHRLGPRGQRSSPDLNGEKKDAVNMK